MVILSISYTLGGKTMKKALICLLLSTTLFSSLILGSFSVHAEEQNQKKDDTNENLDLSKDVKSAILIERDTGEVLFDKASHEKLPPASMTKIMTMLLIMEELERGDLKLDEMIRISDRAASMGGTQIFLSAGEEMSVNDLLKGIAISSGNDASVALAERIAGSEEAFVQKMNDKVEELQLENTLFQNASGLPAKNHYSTAYDMGMIAKELLRHESITDYTSIYEDYLRKGEKNEFWLVNTNKLVRFYQGVDGLKTGFTNEAKYCLTATAKKDNMRVIAVVMGADTVKKRNATVSQLLDYAFSHYSTKKVIDKGQKITSVEMVKAANKKINIVSSASISTIHKKGEETADITTEILLDKKFDLPMKKGEQKGLFIVKSGDKILSETPLVLEDDVKSASYLTLLKRSLQNMVKVNE